MKAQQDIEQQLAAAQQAWETTPAPELWDRLADRLDGQGPTLPPKSSPKWLFRIAVVAIIATIGLGTAILLPGHSPSDLKAKSFLTHLTEFEVIRIARLDEVLVSSPAKATKGLQFGANIGLGNSAKTTNTGLLAQNPSTFSQQRSGSIFSMNGSGRLLLGTKPNGAVANAINEAQTISKPGLIVSNSSGNPIDTISSLQQFRNYEAGDLNAYLQLNAASNQMNYNMQQANNPQTQQNLQHLKWLLGSWKTSGTSAGGMEEWRQKDDFTMLGRGFFVVNGDTIITEEMRIEQRGPDLYFIIVKDQNQKAMKFRLRSSQPNELIFEDARSKSEAEVVLRNNPSTNQLERIYQEDPKVQSQNKAVKANMERRVLSR
jgi:hypothetical protein